MKLYNIFSPLSYLLILISNSSSKATDVIPKNEVEKKLLIFFTKWRSDNSSLSISLPSLDVITIPGMNGHYVGTGVNLQYSSSSMKLVGMNNFSVVDLRVMYGYLGMHARGSLDIPILSIGADNYEISGYALHLYSLNGSGKLWASFQNINLTFLLVISRNGTSSSITNLKLNFAVNNIKVNLENSSWPLNKVLNNEGVKLIDGYKTEILAAAEANLRKTFNNYLETVTLEKLLDMISG